MEIGSSTTPLILQARPAFSARLSTVVNRNGLGGHPAHQPARQQDFRGRKRGPSLRPLGAGKLRALRQAVMGELQPTVFVLSQWGGPIVSKS